MIYLKMHSTKADPGRLRIVVYGTEYDASTSSMVHKEARDSNTGQVLTKPPPDNEFEIFMMLKTCRDNEPRYTYMYM